MTVLAGIGVGAFVALWLTHSLGDAMQGVACVHVLSLVSGEVVLLLVAAAACIGPVRQATRANPVEILRVS